MLLLAVRPARAQPPIFSAQDLPRLKRGMHAVYSLEHDQAIAEYKALIRERPEDPLGYAFLAKTYWLKELVAKQELSIDRFAASDFFAENPRYVPAVDPESERLFREASDQAVEKARALLGRNPGDPRALFLLGMAYQNVASFEASLKRAWWASFRAGSKSNRYHRELLESHPKLYDAYLTTGRVRLRHRQSRLGDPLAGVPAGPSGTAKKKAASNCARPPPGRSCSETTRASFWR